MMITIPIQMHAEDVTYFTSDDEPEPIKILIENIEEHLHTEANRRRQHVRYFLARIRPETN